VGQEAVSEFPQDPVKVWAGMAGKFQVETVPGDHLGMLIKHYQNLGSVLTKYIEQN